MKGQDFFSPQTKETAERIVNTMYKRLAVSGEDLDAVERRARIIAIKYCQENEPSFWESFRSR